MFHLKKHQLCTICITCIRSVKTRALSLSSTIQLPDYADIVIVGGGSAGCNALYHLGKRGINAVLLDKSKLTSGTTWHTAGLIWSMRSPNDVDMELLSVTKSVLNSLEKETGINPGWIKNGGLYIAHSNERLTDYKRLITSSKAFGIEAHLISPQEATKLFPILDENAFQGAIYCSEDGGVDPTMLINALVKSAKNNGCQVIEDCPVTKILQKDTILNKKRVYGVETPYGTIKTDIVLNAAGVWSKNVANMVQVDIPLTPMKHAYVVTEPIEGLQHLPNVRDPDRNIYFRIQGNSLAAGGYEKNPILLESVPEHFSFRLYELDWDIFSTHQNSMTQLIPKLSTTGIRTTVCGPESFTPDHRPIMGEDPNCSGLFYSCGYNSAGMMLGGGCGEQIAHWIINGRPNRYMFNYDIRRFIPEQRNNLIWTNERSHEAYAKNYNIVFPHDEPLSGRNFKKDPFHDLFVEEGAVMEERQGWERPGWFYRNKKLKVMPYDYGGYCEIPRNENDEYRAILEKEYSFQLSSYDNIIREEALACRKNAALFNMSYLGKFYLCGPEAQKTADYLFTANTNCEFNKTVYTCMLNNAGGVEMDCTVTILEPGSSGIVNPIFKEKAFYIVSSGISAYHTWVHMNEVIERNGFDVSLHDVTEQIGLLSVQGPNSRKIIETLIDDELLNEDFKLSTTKLVKIKGEVVRLIRLSFVGELGFELHIPKSSCQIVYRALMECGKSYDMRLAGYRALYSLSCEKGYHLWGSDLRPDDNPVEAGLAFSCRSIGQYLGKLAVDQLQQNGIKRRLVHIHMNDTVPIWGMEAIYRDNSFVGYLRRAEQGYSYGNTIGIGYIEHPNGENVTKEFLQTGSYEIEVMGERHTANLYLRSPFDPQNKRLMGIY
ncbi:sarcosine dehydrogenase, mitochondrial isoform X1 [Colletes gigas]|uniref:sarcosine dehydrogenase, mitochondrial isoform X1 n=2 Tax=Colletes gigas TaxID=935657 RepID=UPI001C9A907D|nr:sarcosine dehydrogenase, mitochondrial isoform X1 [Colletes gigas]